MNMTPTSSFAWADDSQSFNSTRSLEEVSGWVNLNFIELSDLIQASQLLVWTDVV